MGDLVHPVRVAVSGTGVGPGLFEMLAVMGRSACSGASAAPWPSTADEERRRAAQTVHFPQYGKLFGIFSTGIFHVWKTFRDFFHAMENFSGFFPQYGKKFSTVWKTVHATMQGLTPLLVFVAAAGLLAGAGGCASVKANRLAVPKAERWAVSASASEAGFGPEQVLDGQTNTWWRSGPEEPQWIEVDLGRVAMVCGLSLHWADPHAVAYAVRTSRDGAHWALAYETTGGDGDWDQVLFEPVLARHVQVGVARGLQGAGAALRTLEIKGLADRPQVWVDGASIPDALALLDDDLSTTWRSPNASAVLEMDLRRERVLGSVRVDWGPQGFASNVVVEVSTNRTAWATAGRLQARAGDFDVLMGNEVHVARYLRLSFSGASTEEGFEVAGISLRGAEGMARPWAMYELAAAHAPEGIYPDVFRRRQNYWTVAGGGRPGDAESVLDEWGRFAPDAQSPSLEPLVVMGDEAFSARQATDIEYRLAGDGAPMPETVWRLPSGLSLRIRAMVRPGTGLALSWVGYELANDSIMAQTGRVAWVVRPVRVPPPWAGGGLAPIYRLRRADSAGGWQELWANGRRLFAVPDAGMSFGVAAFAGGDVAEYFLRAEEPVLQSVRDDDGLASAAWWRDFDLAPGERIRLVVGAMAPTAGGAATARRFPWPEVPGGGDKVADEFERQWVEGSWEWRAETDRYAPKIDRPDAIDCLQAQVGWLLAVRNLARGDAGEEVETIALRVAALLRAGQAPVARQWVEQVARGLATDGWVPAAFLPDGAPAPRVGWEGRHGTQGQFPFMVMELYRFTQDAAFLNAHYPAMRGAMAYLGRLRADLEKDEGRLPVEERELLEGLLPLSGARPGHPQPGHVYADQYWALLGWKELRTAASMLGRNEDVIWADEQYRALKASVRRSLRAHLDRRDSSWLPATAEEDRFDAASVALLFWPCGETDLVEPHELQSSLDLFYEEFLRRDAVGTTLRMSSDESLLLAPLAALGRGDYAREVLYALLGRRLPRGWHTWADVAVGDPRKPGWVGSMPDVRAAAAYVIGVRGLAAREADRRLDLFSGAPAEWLQHGEGFRVYGMPTAFGPLDLHGFWQRDRMRIEIGGGARPPEGYRIWWPRQIAPDRVLANGSHVKEFDAQGVHLPHDFQGTVDVVFPFLAPWPRDP
jgi:hypothetical protein